MELEERMFFELVNSLEKEVNSLYDEIIDMNNETLYKFNDVAERLTATMLLFNKMTEMFEYYYKKGEDNYMSATRRFQLKKALTILTTVYAFLANPLLGIGSFVLLNMKATKDYAYELEGLDEFLDRFDEEKIIKMSNTLENSRRIFNGKIENAHNIKFNRKNALILVANRCIRSYIDGEIDIDFLEDSTDEFKEIIVRALKRGLNSDSNDIYELLEMAKNKNNIDNKVLTKKLGKK